MSERGNSSGRGTRVSGSVITGLLLVPATAIAAVAIVGATTRPPAAEAVDLVAEITTTTEQIEEGTTTSTTVADHLDELSNEEALRTACTSGAEALIESETEESIGDLESAALDALRQICDEHGMTIAGPPEPEPIVRVVTVRASENTTSNAAETSADPDDDEYDDHDDEDEEDDHDDEEDED
jgi:hypothetical protein